MATDQLANIEQADATEQAMTYVVEQQVDERDWQVVGVRLSLAAAFELGEHAIGDTTDWGSLREWKIEWREDTTWSRLDGDNSVLRDWSGHRPSTPKPTHTFIGHVIPDEKPHETYAGITITEHPVPDERRRAH